MTNTLLTKLCSFAHKTRFGFARLVVQFVVKNVLNFFVQFQKTPSSVLNFRYSHPRCPAFIHQCQVVWICGFVYYPIHLFNITKFIYLFLSTKLYYKHKTLELEIGIYELIKYIHRKDKKNL